MERQRKNTLIIHAADRYLGFPYKYGAFRNATSVIDPDGFDCSFFTHWIYKEALDIPLPLSSLEQASVAFRNDQEVKSIMHAQTGDLIFFRGDQGHYNDNLFENSDKNIFIGHVGIYEKETESVIHAQSKMGVIKERLADLQERNPKSYHITFIGNYY